MSYGSERHRRKVMREMRLAGYDLPGTPYRRVNRKFKYKNKRTGVSTAKIKTSQKTITGMRSTMYVKYNWNPDPQKRAMFAAMMAKKADGSYVPKPKEDGSYTREDKRWNEWIAGGKKGPSPYELKHPQMMQLYKIPPGSDQDCNTWKGQKTLTPQGVVDRYDMDKSNVEHYCKLQHMKVPPEGSDEFKRLMLKIDQISIHRSSDPEALVRRISEMQEKNPYLTREQANEKVSNEMMKEVEDSIDKGIFEKPVTGQTMTKKQAAGAIKALHDEQMLRMTETLKRHPELDSPIKIKLNGKWYPSTMATFEETMAKHGARKIDDVVVGMPGSTSKELDTASSILDSTKHKPTTAVQIPYPVLKRMEQEQKRLKKRQDQEFQRLKELERQNEIRRNREILKKQNEPKRTPVEKPYHPPIDTSRKPLEYTPIEQSTESPTARAKRLARETEAKSAQKKADKENRYKKSYRRPPKRGKPSDDGWGDLIEAKPRKKSKRIKRKKIAGYDTIIATRRRKRSKSTPRKKAGFGDTFFSAAERGWKRIEAGRAKRKAAHETEEYKQRQEERAKRREEGIREFKEQSKHVEHDVKEGYKREKKKWTNEKVSGPGYDWAGHPIKGYKPPEKKPEPKQESHEEEKEEAEE